MTAKFAMPALGKGSVASFVKAALEVVWWMLWIAATGLTIGIIGYGALLVLISAGVVSPDIFNVGETRVDLDVIGVNTDAETGLRLVIPPALLAACVVVGGSLLIVLHLRRLFRNFTSGEPFSAENAKHLRGIWVTMLVMELSRYAIAGLVFALVSLVGEREGAPETSITIAAPIDFTTWGTIFILIVLAEVFREGARMKEEQELTI